MVFTSFGYRRINYWIRFGCLGISASVFVAWQYALRDSSNLLAGPELWEWLDVQLPARALGRVRKFLDDNFCLRWGDQRVRPWTLITNAFSHVRWQHFLLNTLAFNSCCNLLELTVPPLHFASLILTTGLAGSTGFLIQQSQSKFPNRGVKGLGMSGITSGIAMATAVLDPYALVFLVGFPVPIWIALGAYTAWNVAFLRSTISTTGHAAHLGGALVGLLYATTLKTFTTSTLDPGELLKASSIVRNSRSLRS